MIGHRRLTRQAMSLGLCLSLGWPALTLAQTLPQLPQIPDISCGTSSGKTTAVPNGGKLQAVLDSAAPGDTIVLEAGATFIGPITLPLKTGTGCITIRTSALDSQLPKTNERISPAYSNVLPKIVSPGLNQVALKSAYGAHHYKLVGIEFTKANESAVAYALIELGDGLMTSLSQVPHHIELNHVYVHGMPASSLKHCVILNGAALSVRNSYISECKISGFDSQAILGYNGPGPMKILNNYIEGAGENLMFGGGDPHIPNLVPSDVEIRQNLFSKPLRWKVADPSSTVTHWSVKNLFELKNARRILVDGNIFEYSWADAQVGFAILFTVRNQDNTAPWSTVEDVTFTNNIIRHAGAGLQLLGTDSPFPSQVTKRILIRNNLWLDIGNPEWGGSGRLFQITAGPVDVTIEHNTAFQTGPFLLSADSPPSLNFIFRDNIVPHNEYGLFGDATGVGLSALNKFFPDYQFTHNVIISNPFPNNYPTDNYNAPGITAIGFRNVANGDYGLTAISPYARKATDQTDIGVDWAALQAAILGTGTIASAGPKSPSNLQIAPGAR